MARTTISVDDALLLEAKQLAAQRGTTLTAVVQEALRSYLAANRAPRRLAWIGQGRSGRSDVSAHDEELLAAAADRVDGLRPPGG
jgi:predicted transcriptional regulator